MNSDMTV